jgi:hypothetical protein
MAEQELEIGVKINPDPSGAQESIADIAKVKAAGNAAAEAEKAATDKVISSKTQLRQAIKGLGYAFPALGHIARLALSPITLSIAGIIYAFKLWQERIESLTRTLGGVPMDMPALDPARISKAKVAWEEYAKAVGEAMEKVKSVNTEFERAIDLMKQQHDNKVKLLAAQKELELAQLEESKGTMTGAQYESTRIGIEKKYGRAGLQADANLARGTQDQRELEAHILMARAGTRVEQAKGIKVMSEETEATLTAKYKAQMESSQKEIADAREKLGKFELDEKGNPKDPSAWLGGKTPQQQKDRIAIESRKYAEAVQFFQKGPARAARRGQQNALLTGAAADYETALGITSTAGADRKAINASIETDKMVQDLTLLAKTIKDLADSREKVNELNKQVEQLSGSNKGLMQSMVGKVVDANQVNLMLQKQVNDMRTSINANRTGK